MDNRQRYVSQKMVKASKAMKNDNQDVVNVDVSSDVAEIIEEMKSIVVSPPTLALLKSKLQVTREYRAQLLENDQRSDVLELFPYFFVNERHEKQNLNIDLVSFCYFCVFS